MAAAPPRGTHASAVADEEELVAMATDIVAPKQTDEARAKAEETTKETMAAAKAPGLAESVGSFFQGFFGGDGSEAVEAEAVAAEAVAAAARAATTVLQGAETRDPFKTHATMPVLMRSGCNCDSYSSIVSFSV